MGGGDEDISRSKITMLYQTVSISRSALLMYKKKHAMQNGSIFDVNVESANPREVG